MAGWDKLDDPTDWGLNGPGGGTPPQSQGFDWANGFASLGKGLLKDFLPGAASTAAGGLINKFMPGRGQTNQLQDTRNPEQQQAAQFGMNRVNSLTANPSGFGLPGDPSDINTPAGRKTWDIRNSSRSADAARGMSNTGGSAQRETDALNRAIGGEFNTSMNSGLQAAGSGYPMHVNQTPAQDNPWAKLLGSALDPAIRNSMTSMLQKWGLA